MTSLYASCRSSEPLPVGGRRDSDRRLAKPRFSAESCPCSTSVRIRRTTTSIGARLCHVEEEEDDDDEKEEYAVEDEEEEEDERVEGSDEDKEEETLPVRLPARVRS